MTDDRTLERAARAWLEEGPTQAPDRPVEAALTRIQTTSQELDLRLPWIAWRPRTMFDRLAVAAAVAVVAIGTFTLGASLILKPHEPAAGACPREFSEAEAIDTSAPGLSQAQRAWGIAGGTPGHVHPGLIAAYARDTLDGPSSVITIDPATGARCRLLTYRGLYAGDNRDALDWSPSGDALAIGIGIPNGPARILIWTPGRLFRVWSGDGEIPSFEWAPDGRSIAVWAPIGFQTFNARIIFADGTPDREFGVQPVGLKWSPDGARWIVAENIDVSLSSNPTRVTVVDLADGRLTPIDIGMNRLTPKGWIDNERVLLYGGNEVGFLDVPVAAPASYSVVPLPEDAPDIFQYVAFSPDWRRATYANADGDREIADLTSPPGTAPVHVDVGRGYTWGAGWAPDSSQLVLATVVSLNDTAGGRNPTLATWIVNADGSNVRQVLVGNVLPTADSWQPVPVR